MVIRFLCVSEFRYKVAFDRPYSGIRISRIADRLLLLTTFGKTFLQLTFADADMII